MTGVLPQNIVDRMSQEDRAAYAKTVGYPNAGLTSNEAREKAIVKDEKELQKQVAGYLRMLGLWYAQSRMDRRTANTVGTPDFITVYKGQPVFWECKTPWAAKLRPEQAETRDAIIAQGGQWRLITALSEAQAHLREIDATKNELLGKNSFNSLDCRQK